jgi:hypothetical protein
LYAFRHLTRSRALTEGGGLTPEQIEEMKQKMRDRKKGGAKAMEVEALSGRQEDAVESMMERSVRTKVVKDIRVREKALCTPQSILQSDGKPFTQCLHKIQVE